MFTGQAGCFCCSDPPDPPPPCVTCEACTGEAPGDCEDKVCESFVIEVEGFANTTTVRNCDFVGPATGTACTAYNGTFVLEQVENQPCVFRSAEFTATVPMHTFINQAPCYECFNDLVYYELRFVSAFSDIMQHTELSICRAIDGIPFAQAGCSLPATYRPLPGLPQDSLNAYIPAFSEGAPFVGNLMLCHQEPLQQFADSPLHPASFVTYSAVEPYAPGRIQYGVATSGNIGFLGQGFLDDLGAYPNNGITPYAPRTIDECGQVKTTFLGDPEVPVWSPWWVCCKDESFDCDFVRDELAPGNRDLQNIPLLRITSIRCGT